MAWQITRNAFTSARWNKQTLRIRNGWSWQRRQVRVLCSFKCILSVQLHTLAKVHWKQFTDSLSTNRWQTNALIRQLKSWKAKEFRHCGLLWRTKVRVDCLYWHILSSEFTGYLLHLPLVICHCKFSSSLSPALFVFLLVKLYAIRRTNESGCLRDLLDFYLYYFFTGNILYMYLCVCMWSVPVVGLVSFVIWLQE